LVANLYHATELIQSFKQVATDRNYSDQRVFDLGDLTEQVAVSLRPGLGKQNLTPNVTCQPDLMMNSYPGQYGQLLINLFLNSVTHAFPDGKGGTIDIKVQAAGSDAVDIHLALTSGARPLIRSSRHAVIEAAPASACISSTPSSRTIWEAGSISIASPARGRKSISSCRAPPRPHQPLALAKPQQHSGLNRPRGAPAFGNRLRADGLLGPQ
jgi:hypothetical protein